MADLKPCPFCGGEAVTENRHNRWTDWWKVKCMDCNASLNERYEYEFEAVAAWNTRKPMEAVVAELEEMKCYESGCLGVSCDKCKYNESCLEGEEAFKVALDNAIEVVRNGGKE